MYYDLNVPYAANDAHLPRTLAFLHELGYNVVALNHTISGKLPADLTCPIPDPLPLKDVPSNLKVLRRCTLVLIETHQNARLQQLSRNYDLLALRPIDERTLQLACTSLDCDIISLDLTQRLPFWFRHKMLGEAIKLGKRFEMCYASAITGDSNARRNLISNCTQLIRASRGRGLMLASEAKTAIACRAPWDAVNLLAVWGLAADRAFEAVIKECRSVAVTAALKRSSYRGVVDVVYGGEKPAVVEKAEEESGKGKQKQKQPQKQAGSAQKRKAEVVEENGEGGEKTMSKRQMKRQAKEARLQAATAQSEDDSATTAVQNGVDVPTLDQKESAVP